MRLFLWVRAQKTGFLLTLFVVYIIYDGSHNLARGAARQWDMTQRRKNFDGQVSITAMQLMDPTTAHADGGVVTLPVLLYPGF